MDYAVVEQPTNTPVIYLFKDFRYRRKIYYNNFKVACGGQYAISQCTINRTCQPGLVCTASNYCCQCPVGTSGGRCNRVFYYICSVLFFYRDYAQPDLLVIQMDTVVLRAPIIQLLMECV
jgi:hypothetical protein